MPAGTRALRRIQIGKEAAATRGTAVIPTAMLIGKVNMKMEQELYMPEDMETGNLASFQRSEVLARETSLSYESDANYEQLPYMLQMAIRAAPTPTGPAPFEFAYTPNYTARPNQARLPESLTMRYGDEIQVWQSSYVSCRQLTLSGQVGDVVKVKADLFGREQTVVTTSPPFISGVLRPVSLEAVKMANCTLHYATSFAGLALPASLMTATLVDFDWTFTTGYTPQKFADGRIDFSELGVAKRHVELSMTVAFNSDTKDWYTQFRGQDKMYFEIRFDNGRTGGVERGLQLRQACKLTEFNELTEREGQDIVKLKFVSEYDAASGVLKDMDVIVTRGAATLP